ncbi:type II toxin-antitoxin system Phd/YefM family antitoxin [Rhodoferax sp. 4810]|nr:type II toxin-antitoxin system Phd/YefM family antitoxin [Rhodoferax jenense]
MSAIWQVQEAKNRFSELIEQALTQGPQVITRHGRAVARVVSASQPVDTVQTALAADGFAQYLLSAPKVSEFELPVRRSRKSALALGG